MGASRSDIISFLSGDDSVSRKILAEAGSERKAVREIIEVQKSLTPEEQQQLPQYIKQIFEYEYPYRQPGPLPRIPAEAL